MPGAPTAFIGVMVEGVQLACALPLSHALATAGTVLWDAAIVGLCFVLLTGVSLKPGVFGRQT